MRKRFLSLFTLVLFLFVFSSCNNEPQTPPPSSNGVLEYTLVRNEYYIVSGIGTVTDSNVVIPSMYNGFAVKGIGEYSFQNCTNIKSITIPESIETIGTFAFSGCTYIEKIYFNATRCQDAETSDNIFDCVGQNSSGVEVVFGNSVERIPANLFATSSTKNFANITSTSLGSNVKFIGKRAFYYCSSLKSISISDNLEHISVNVFEGCTSLQFNEYDRCNYLGSNNNPYLILYNTIDDAISDCEINQNCKFIYGRAFDSFTLISNVTIPANVISIGENSFSCHLLKNVYFEDADSWYVTDNLVDWEEKTNGESVIVTNSADNVELLTDTHYLKFWYKK